MGARATIAAIATPSGLGAVAIVRVSGPDAFSVAGQVVRMPAPVASHRAFVRAARFRGEVIDQVLVLPFVGPKSFTGEDTVELHCHGGRVTPRLVLDAILAAGALPADPGAFTAQALANGRLDLTQAEAIADVIHAESLAGQRLALEHLRGGLARAVDALKAQVASLLVHVEAGIDFSAEEDVPAVDLAELAAQCGRIDQGLAALLSGHERGRVLVEGVRVAIVGAPNAGKSTLFNHWAGDNRAIVTPFAGTTRDTLEVWIDRRGQHFILVDTAGLRRAQDPVEALGIERSQRAVSDADAVVVVVDAAEGDPGPAVWRLAEEKPFAVVWNKLDLCAAPEVGAEGAACSGRGAAVEVRVSLATGVGLAALDGLLDALGAAAGLGAASETVAIARARHRRCLETARACVGRASDAAAQELGDEVVALELREALDALGAITGAITSDDVLNEIFSGFCVGK